MMGEMWGWWGWIGGIFMMIFWILVIVALALFIRWLASAGGNRSRLLPGPGESAVDILRKRYARGELTKEQFESMKRDLEE
jgi:putative membrane protein